jgi:precorrin-2 dehydrogenase/sirohydrochlorin ferrochelatase
VAPFFRAETAKIAEQNQILCIKDHYKQEYLDGHHLVIAATNDPGVNQRIYKDCRQRQLLVNVADNPPLCDFYMGGIVTKGHVKVAISTNGKSPTTAKRLRQFFEAILPEDISLLVQNLNAYRKTLGGSFEDKVAKMNDITRPLVEDNTRTL